MKKINIITKKKEKQIIDDLKIYYIGKRYNYEEIFRNSGDYDDIDSNILYEFVSPLIDIINSKGSEEFNRLYNSN